jgi:hypothetical protein
MLRFLFILCLGMGGTLRSAGAAPEAFLEKLTALQAQLGEGHTNTALLFQLGDLCHDEGVQDNPQAVILAQKYFEQVLALEPNHAMAMVLLGSTFTMKGRDAFWPTTRIELVKEGNRRMDAAVRLAPEDPRVRFARAINNFHMPKWLGREEIVQADFTWLWDKVRAAPGPFRSDFRQEVALHHGLVLKRHKQLDEAATVWRAGLEFDPGSPLAQQIREQLDKAGH